MKASLASLASKWSSQVWFLTASAWEARNATLRTLLASASLPLPKGALPNRPTEDAWGNEVKQPYKVNGIAVVPVNGTLVKDASPIEKYFFGDMDYSDVLQDVRAGMDIADVVLLDINSPGGSAAGLPEVTGAIMDESRKRGKLVLSYSDSLEASAAYYLGLAAETRAASPSALVGSIGSIAATVSFKRMLDGAGIDAEVFTSGDLKATGHPFNAMTDEQRGYMQRIVDGYGQLFKDFVTVRTEGRVDFDAMRGQVFMGDEAKKAGLIEELYDSVENMVATFGWNG